MVAVLLALPFLGSAQGFEWKMEPKYVGEIHLGYKTTTHVKDFNTYSGMVELGTLQGVSLNQYLEMGIGVDAFMMTHYYPGHDVRVGADIYFDIRPSYPVTDQFKVFLDLGLGGYFGIYSEPKMDDGFYCQFGPGFRYRKFNLSLGLQSFGTKDGSVGFFTKLGLYF